MTKEPSISEIKQKIQNLCFASSFLHSQNSTMVVRRRKRTQDRLHQSELLGRLIAFGQTIFTRDHIPWIISANLSRKTADSVIKTLELDEFYNWEMLIALYLLNLEEECKKLNLQDIQDMIHPKIYSFNQLSGSSNVVKSYCASSIKNIRHHMEDYYCVIPDLSLVSDFKGNGAYFAVFDGHCGHQAAAYSSYQLHYLIVDKLSQIDTTVSRKNTENAIIRAIVDCDERFVLKGDKSGTTVALVLLLEGDLYCAWLGDSQIGCVYADHTVRRVTVPHKPGLEKERIIAAGGTVTFSGDWRVNGMLTVSRSIGSVELKPCISNIAEVTVLDEWGCRHLILGTDGFWDVFQDDELGPIVEQCLKEGEEVADALVKEAVSRGSTDNISVIVLELSTLGDLNSNAGGRFGCDVKCSACNIL